MPPGKEVIDLSLSTDDDDDGSSDARKDSTESTILRGGTHVENPRGGFWGLADIDLDATSPANKKRRASQSLDGENDDGGFAAVDNFSESRLVLGSLDGGAATAVTTRSEKVKGVEGWNSDDFFVLSSPPPPPPRRDRLIVERGDVRREEVRCLSSDDSDDSFPEDIVFKSKQQPSRASCLSHRTSALLARLDKPVKRKRPPSGEKGDGPERRSVRRGRSAESDNQKLDSEVVQKSGTSKPSKKNQLTDVEKAAKLEEKENLRAANKALKAKEKEEALEAKRILKEEKAKQKQIDAALAEVNKSKIDKKVTGPEMIVDLPASINGQMVDTQIREFLKNLQIDVSLYQSPLPNTIKWRRKVKSRYSEAKGHWEVVEPMEIEEEKFVMCLMSAKEFVALASGVQQHGFSDIEAHVAMLKTNFSGCKPIYLIEGLNSWMRKNKTTLNRAYQAAVLNQLDDQEDATRRGNQTLNSRRKKDVHEHVDENMIEDTLLRLQMMNGCLVHHTTNAVESAEWVAIFTQQISTIPTRYRFSTLGFVWG